MVEDKNTPCSECEDNFPGRKAPVLLPGNYLCLEVHDRCFQARDGMSGALDYSFLAHVMGLMDLDKQEQLDIIDKIQRVENNLKENKQKK